jgi:hypothetical protein
LSFIATSGKGDEIEWTLIIFQNTTSLANTPSSVPIKKEDLETKNKINDISNKQLHSRRGVPGFAKGKAAAIEFMAPYKIDRNDNNEDK